MWVLLGPAEAREVLGGGHHSLLLDSRDRSDPTLGHQSRVAPEGATLHGAGAVQKVHIEDRSEIQVQPHESHFPGGKAGPPAHGLGTLSAQDLCIGKLGKGRGQAGHRSSLLIHGEKKRTPELLKGEVLDIPAESCDLLWGCDVPPKKSQTGRLDRANVMGQGGVQLLAEEANH
jgi:hypothetical protein